MNVPQIKLLAPNLTAVYFSDVTLYYSYDTCIAFMYKGKTVISENVWSNTTKKHLNRLGKNRVSYQNFLQQIKELP